MFHGHLDCFQKPPLGGRSNTKLGVHGTPNAHNVGLFYFIMCEDPTWIEIIWNSIWLRAWVHMTSHHTWGPVTILHDFWRCVGTAFGHFSFGISQFHGHGSWLVWEVVLREWLYHVKVSSLKCLLKAHNSVDSCSYVFNTHPLYEGFLIQPCSFSIDCFKWRADKNK
jgi:hypothetical protein